MSDLKKIFVILISAALIPGFLCSSPILAAESEPGVFTLSRSVALALENSISLDSADRAIEKAEWEKKKAFKNFLPTLSGTYSYTRLDESPSTKVVEYGAVNTGTPVLPVIPTGSRQVNVGTADNYQARATLTQPLFTGYRLKSAYELSKLGIDMATVDKEKETLDIVLRAKESYFGILQAEKAVEVSDQAIRQFEAHLNVAQNFYNVGMITKNQVLEAEVNLAEAMQAKIAADNLLSLAKARFNTLLRRSIDASVQVEDILAYKPFGHDFQYCLDQAMTLRPEIKAVQHRITMAEEQVRLSRSGYYPSVALTANHNWRGDNYRVHGSDFMDDHTSWDITLAMTWEFWNWMKTRDAVRSSRSDLDIAYNGLMQLKDGIELEVKNYFLLLEEAEKQITVAEKSIERAEENYRMSEERYKAQVGTSTEVIDAATMLIAAKRRYYDALYKYNLAWATLERVMGYGRDSI